MFFSLKEIGKISLDDSSATGSRVDGACAKSLVLLQKFRIFTLTNSLVGGHNSALKNYVAVRVDASHLSRIYRFIMKYDSTMFLASFIDGCRSQDINKAVPYY